MRKKLISLLMAGVMIVSLLPAAAIAATYNDIAGNWAEEHIERWSDVGVVNGDGTGNFNPSSQITRAETAQAFVNLLRLSESADISKFADVPNNAWFANAISKCFAAGILQGTNDAGTTMSPLSLLSREQLFVMTARALGVKDEESNDKNFADSGEVSSWAAGSINALVNMGAVSGIDSSHLAPLTDIDRASVMALLDRMIASYVTENGEATIAENGITLVVAEDVKLVGKAGDKAHIVLAGNCSKVDMSGIEGTPYVAVKKDNVTITGAPAGTVFETSGVENVTVNDHDMNSTENFTVPEAKPSRPNGGGGGGNGGYTPQSDTYTITAKVIESEESSKGIFTPKLSIGDATPSVGSIKFKQGEQVTLTIEHNQEKNDKTTPWFVYQVNVKKDGELVNSTVELTGAQTDGTGKAAAYTLKTNNITDDLVVEIILTQYPGDNCNRPDNDCVFPEYTTGAEFTPDGTSTADRRIVDFSTGSYCKVVGSEKKTSYKGARMEFELIVTDGYRIKSILAYDGDNNLINYSASLAGGKDGKENKYSFTMPDSDVTVMVSTAKLAENDPDSNCLYPEMNCKPEDDPSLEEDGGTPGPENTQAG